MQLFTKLFIATILIKLVSFSAGTAQKQFRRVCYFTNWSCDLLEPEAHFCLRHIDASLCTHFVYAFAQIDPVAFTLTSTRRDDEGKEEVKGRYTRFNEMIKNTSLEAKTLLSIGGLNQTEPSFNTVSRTPRLRTLFAHHCAIYLRHWGFDGLDVDWEYPEKEDKVLLTLLLKALRLEFRDEARHTGQQELILSVAAPVSKQRVNAGYDVAGLSSHVDMINLMAYDFHGAWSDVAGVNSPLYPRRSDTRFSTEHSVEWSVNHWITLGAPPQKLNLGIAGYGQSYTLKATTGGESHTVTLPHSEKSENPGLPSTQNSDSGVSPVVNLSLSPSPVTVEDSSGDFQVGGPTVGVTSDKYNGTNLADPDRRTLSQSSRTSVQRNMVLSVDRPSQPELFALEKDNEFPGNESVPRNASENEKDSEHTPLSEVKSQPDGGEIKSRPDRGEVKSRAEPVRRSILISAEVGSTSIGPGRPGRLRHLSGQLSFPEICELIQAGGQEGWDQEQQVPYVTSGDQWVGYDNARSVAEKVRWALNHGLGGIMFWSLDLDDFKGDYCGKGRYPLLSAITDTVNSLLPTADSSVVQERQALETTAPSNGKDTAKEMNDLDVQSMGTTSYSPHHAATDGEKEQGKGQAMVTETLIGETAYRNTTWEKHAEETYQTITVSGSVTRSLAGKDKEEENNAISRTMEIQPVEAVNEWDTVRNAGVARVITSGHSPPASPLELTHLLIEPTPGEPSDLAVTQSTPGDASSLEYTQPLAESLYGFYDASDLTELTLGVEHASDLIESTHGFDDDLALTELTLGVEDDSDLIESTHGFDDASDLTELTLGVEDDSDLIESTHDFDDDSAFTEYTLNVDDDSALIESTLSVDDDSTLELTHLLTESTPSVDEHVTDLDYCDYDESYSTRNNIWVSSIPGMYSTQQEHSLSSTTESSLPPRFTTHVEQYDHTATSSDSREDLTRGHIKVTSMYLTTGTQRIPSMNPAITSSISTDHESDNQYSFTTTTTATSTTQGEFGSNGDPKVSPVIKVEIEEAPNINRTEDSHYKPEKKISDSHTSDVPTEKLTASDLKIKPKLSSSDSNHGTKTLTGSDVDPTRLEASVQPKPDDFDLYPELIDDIFLEPGAEVYYDINEEFINDYFYYIAFKREIPDATTESTEKSSAKQNASLTSEVNNRESVEETDVTSLQERPPRTGGNYVAGRYNSGQSHSARDAVTVCITTSVLILFFTTYLF